MENNEVSYKDQFIKIGELKLHYLEWGRAKSEDILLLHGNMGHAHLWDFLARQLASEYYLIALDQRGHGDSQWAVPPAYSSDDYVGDLSAFIDMLNLRSPVIIGHSMGALHAAIYTGTYPRRIKGLVFIDIEAKPHSRWRAYLQKGGQHPHPEFNSIDEAIENERKSPTGPISTAQESILWYVTGHGTKTTSTGKLTYKYDRNTLSLWDEYDVRPFMSRILCPTMIIRGENSAVLQPETAQRMVGMLSKCRLVEVEKAGHMVMLDNPDALGDIIKRFLYDIQ